MRNTKLLLGLGLVLGAAALAWNLSGVVGHGSGAAGGTPDQAGRGVESGGSGQPQAMPDAARRAGSGGAGPAFSRDRRDVPSLVGEASPGVGSADGREPSAAEARPGDVEEFPEVAAMRVSHPQAGESAATPPPLVSLPPDVRTEDVEMSPENGMVGLKRPRPGAEQGPPADVILLPPGVSPDEVRTSPKSGVARLVQPPPGSDDTPSPSLALLSPDAPLNDIDVATSGVVATQKRPAIGGSAAPPQLFAHSPGQAGATPKVSPSGAAVVKK